jgi:hypothetical protein
MRTSFAAAGDIRDVDLLAAFVGFWREKRSGSVRFSRAAASAGFDLSTGEVTAVFSSEPRFATAAVLMRAGKLEAGALERLSVPEGGDAALAALTAGILTKREWRWGEKIRAIEILSDLLLWPDGNYLFDAETHAARAESALPIPRLVLELFLRSRDPNLIEHQLGSSEAPLLRAPGFEEEFTTFGLTADAESVVRLIDGRASATEISRTAPSDQFAVLKLLAALATLGLVRPAQTLPGRALRTAAEARPVPGEPDPWPDRPAWGVSSRGEPPEEAEPTAALTEIPVLAPAPGAGEGIEASPEEETSAESFDSDFSLPQERPFSEKGSRPGRPATLVWLLGILLAGIAITLFVRSRALPRQEPVSKPPATIVAPPPPSPRKALVPTLPPTPAAVPVPSAQAKASARPPRAASTPPVARQQNVAGAGLNDAARQQWVKRAEHDRKRLASEPATRFAIQLELACEVSSLTKSWKHDRPAGSMWLLVTPHRGRDCFRVLWGRYRTREAAMRAKADIPPFFVTPSNRPRVVAVP